MFYRVAFIFIAIFWVTMNVLLWRSEYVQQDTAGSEVSLQTVWWKILNAPDTSALEIKQHGKTLGFCRWATELSEQLPAQKKSAAVEVEDMITRPANYQIALEGTVMLPGISNRLRFDFASTLSTNREWQDFTLRINLRPGIWELRAVAAEEMLHFKMDDGAGSLEQDFKFSELQNPQALLREFAGPLPLALLTDAGLPLATGPATRPMGLGLQWQAHESWLRLGHSPVRVYRLETRLLDRYPIVFIISRAGEILKVELPNDVRLINEQLAAP